MRAPFRFAALAAAVLAAPAHAQDTVLVERLTNVSVARAGEAVMVTASGTVPISGFSNPALRPRPDLVKVENGYVLDFVATPPGAATAQVESRITVTYRIEGPEAAKLRFVQIRAALGSRTVQVPVK